MHLEAKYLKHTSIEAACADIYQVVLQQRVRVSLEYGRHSQDNLAHRLSAASFSHGPGQPTNIIKFYSLRSKSSLTSVMPSSTGAWKTS
jgi:hypothetical protein